MGLERRPTLWVIDPSVSKAEDQGVREILRGWRGDHRIFQPCLRPGDGPGPQTGYETDAVVLMGSGASVYDGPDWMASLEAWLRPLMLGEPKRPVLGVCFGHQFIAHLAGGRVDYIREDRAKRVGVEITQLRGGRLLPDDPDLRVVVSHREEVKQAPAGYRVTAGRDGIPVDGIEHVDLPVFSYQFHPEARDEFAQRQGLDISEIDERLRVDSRKLIDAFLAIV